MLEQEICFWSNGVMSIYTKISEQCFQHQESTPVSLGLWKISTALQSTLFNLEQHVRMLFEDFSFVFSTINPDRLDTKYSVLGLHNLFVTGLCDYLRLDC